MTDNFKWICYGELILWHTKHRNTARTICCSAESELVKKWVREISM